MTRARYSAGCSIVYVFALFFWGLLIGASSRNPVAPAQADKPAASPLYTYWDPDEGLNAGADLIYREKRLVGISFHMAL